MKKVLLLAGMSVVLLACSSHKNDTNSSAAASAAIFEQGPVDSAYVAIRPAVQMFTIDNRQLNKIKGSGGTEVLIPANCFETADGVAAGDVQVQLAEAFSLPAFIGSGLTTLSDGKLLVSNGMVYVNARSGGEPLRVAKGASLTVSMPTMGNAGGFSMFRGDGKNWTVDSSMTEVGYSIPLPMDLLYPGGNEVFWRGIVDFGGKKEKKYFLDTTILSVTGHQYENTVIATGEFYSRYNFLRGGMIWMSLFVNRAYYFDEVDIEGEKYNYDIWRVYFDHPTRSLRESDSIARKMYIDYFNANKDKIAAFCEEVNVHKRKCFYNSTDTNYEFDFRKVSLEEQFMEPLKDFQAFETKGLKLVDNHGVNPADSNAYGELLAKGVSVDEANQIMSYNFRRQAMIRLLQRQKDELAQKAAVEKIYETTVFSVTQMGWINCDRFYNDPKAGKAEIYVSNISGERLENIDCSLVIPEVNARLSAYPAIGGRWTFTKKDGVYIRLPIGRDAVVTGVAMRHDSVFFASRKIRIADGLAVGLPMKYVSRSGLKDSLAAAVRN